MKKLVLPVFCLLLFLISCKNDVELLADWKETMVIYGLLNQGDSVQYIKINKAFLGQGNALEMAQEQDSIGYANKLSVQLERWKNNLLLETYTLDTTSEFQKEEGVFSFPSQLIYKTNTNGNLLDDESEYRLNVINTHSGLAIQGKTTLVKSFSISTTPTNFAASVPLKAKWTSAAIGKRYQVAIRFHYKEIDKQIQTDTVSRYVDWVMGTQKSISASGGEPMEELIDGSAFYRFLKANLQENTAVFRQADKLDYMVVVAAEDFNTYMDVNQSSGIIQEKPLYTNIENGLGLFSARYISFRKGLLLPPMALDSLYIGQYTAHLGFCSPNPLSFYRCQ